MDINYKRKSGIYKLIHQKRLIIYIGSATCIYTRLHNHYSQLKKGIHDNKILQAIYNRHGNDNLKWEVVELCPKEQLIQREQFYIDSLKPEINICKNAQNTFGYRHSEEMKKKFSEQRKGNTNSLGRELSQETKKLISEKAKKRGVSKAFMVASKKSNIGRKHTADAIIKRCKKQAKLTCWEVNEIRQLLSDGIYQYVIAKQYGVSQRVINRIHNNFGYYGTIEQTAQLKLL